MSFRRNLLVWVGIIVLLLLLLILLIRSRKQPDPAMAWWNELGCRNGKASRKARPACEKGHYRKPFRTLPLRRETAVQIGLGVATTGFQLAHLSCSPFC